MSDFIKNNNWQRQIFEKVIDGFKKENIPFGILRNYENYPDKFGNDVDMLVPQEFLSKIDKLFQQVSRELNAFFWDFCKDISKISMSRAIFIWDKDGQINGLSFDFIYRLKILEKDYLETETVLQKRKAFKNFYILDEESEFFHILIYGMFAPDLVHRQRYALKIKEFLSNGRLIPEDLINKTFPFFIAKKIINFLKKGEVEKVFFRNNLLDNFFLSIKQKVFLKKIKFYLRKRLKRIVNIFFPVGKFIVFLGPDGVGKSTTAVFLNNLLNFISVPSCHSHLGFRPTVLPRRQALGLGEPKSENFQLQSARISLNQRLRDLLRYSYHFLDYLLAYYFQIRPHLVKGKIVIAERYFYDYLLHLERKNLKLNKNFVYWTFRLFMPKPTAIVLLSNDPDEILRRRQELTREEIEEVLRKSREFGKKVSRFIEIKTDKPPEEIAIELAKWIVCYNKK